MNAIAFSAGMSNCPPPLRLLRERIGPKSAFHRQLRLAENNLMSTVNPIPQGMHSVTPHLVCAGAADAIEFYKKAFGAVEIGPTSRSRRQTHARADPHRRFVGDADRRSAAVERSGTESAQRLSGHHPSLRRRRRWHRGARGRRGRHGGDAACRTCSGATATVYWWIRSAIAGRLRPTSAT